MKSGESRKVAHRPPRIPVASIGRKTLAFTIDFIIIYCTVVVGATMIMQRYVVLTANPAHLSRMMAQEPLLYIICFLFIVIIALSAFLYFVVFEYRLGATPGKKLVGLTLVYETKNRLYSVMMRNIMILGIIFLAIPVVSFIMIGMLCIDVMHQWWDKHARRISDKVARCWISDKRYAK